MLEQGLKYSKCCKNVSDHDHQLNDLGHVHQLLGAFISSSVDGDDNSTHLLGLLTEVSPVKSWPKAWLIGTLKEGWPVTQQMTVLCSWVLPIFLWDFWSLPFDAYEILIYRDSSHLSIVYAANNFLQSTIYHLTLLVLFSGLPWWLSGKDSACNAGSFRRHGFNPWVGKIPWRRAWQPTPVFLPGKSH